MDTYRNHDTQYFNTLLNVYCIACILILKTFILFEKVSAIDKLPLELQLNISRSLI